MWARAVYSAVHLIQILLVVMISHPFKAIPTRLARVLPTQLFSKMHLKRKKFEVEKVCNKIVKSPEACTLSNQLVSAYINNYFTDTYLNIAQIHSSHHKYTEQPTVLDMHTLMHPVGKHHLPALK